MSPKRYNLVEMLAGLLPKFTSATACGGGWRGAFGPARWSLDPAADGYWLSVSPDAGGAMPSLAPNLWPWPLKSVRARPGASTSCQAEWFLRGRGEEPQSLKRDLRKISQWLANPKPHVDKLESADADSATKNWRPLVGEALELPVESSAGDPRVLTRDETPIEFHERDGQLRIVAPLLRTTEPLTEAAAQALGDLLDVVNARVRGCRAAVEQGKDEAPQACLETRLQLLDLSATSIRQAVTTVSRAQAALLPCCQTLAESDAATINYHQCLFLEKGAEA